jgi:branched-chain amino acid transport system substrate-binding protein
LRSVRTVTGLLILTGLAAATAQRAAPDETAGAAAEPILIGLLESTGPTAERLAAGARRAVAEVNAGGGIEGRPLQLRTLAAPRPWNDGASLMARLVFEERVTALIGPTDGAAAHVAAQVATRNRIPVITLSPEESLTRARVPWVFRGVPSDAEQARALLSRVFHETRGRRAEAVVPTGRAGRERLSSLREASRDLGVEIVSVLHADTRGIVPAAADRPVTSQPADVMLLWLDPVPALSFLERLEAGPPRIVGSSRLADEAFVRNLPSRAEGLAVPSLRPDTPPLRGGDRQAEKWIDPGDALGYDMVRLLASAARRGGAEPHRLRDVLESGSDMKGMSGSFRFDRRGNRLGEIRIGIIKGGGIVPIRGRAVVGTHAPHTPELPQHLLP